MATEDEIRKLVDDYSARVRRKFEGFVRQVKSDDVRAEIVTLLENGDIDAAIELVDSYLYPASEVTEEIYVDAARKETQRLAEVFALTSLSFALATPRVTNTIRLNRQEFLQFIGESQRESIRQAVAREFDGTLDQKTQAFVNALGLTARQEEAVNRYKTLLERGSRQALDRTLRDPKFDDKVKTSIRRDKPLTQKQIATMVEAYRKRMVKHRAKTVAQVQAQKIFSQARFEALEQAIEQGGLDRTKIIKTWNPRLDTRTRDHHIVMRGQRRLMDEKFVDGDGNQLSYPGDPSAPLDTIVNCRCVLTITKS